MHPSCKQNQPQPPPTQKFSKFGNRIKSRVNTRILSPEIDILQNLNSQISSIPSTPMSAAMFEFPVSECDLSESTTSFSVKKSKNVKFDDTPILKATIQSGQKKQPISILKNSSLEKQSSILSGSRNLLTNNTNSSFCSNANSQRSRLSASDSVVQNQRQVLAQRNKYKSLLSHCLHHKKKYFDDVFPPGSSSLYSKIHNTNTKYSEVKWTRLSDLYKNYKQYMYSYHPTLKCNILPGASTHIPYLLTCLQTLDTSTRCLERIFEDQKPNETGIYCLRIFLNGVWKYVVVDDYVPTVGVGKSQVPLFVDVEGRRKDVVNIWPLLVLKAYAKVYGGYESLEEGNVADFMNELTGASVERLVLTEENLGTLGEYYNNTDYLVILGKKEANTMHYSPSDNGKSSTFTLSSYLTPSPLISIPNNTPASTPLSSLLPTYSTAIITKTDELYYSISCTLHPIKQTLSIRSFTLPQSTTCHLSLIQKDLRYYKNNGYKYSWTRLLLCMKQPEGVRYITGGFSNEKCIHLDCVLEPGEYYLLVVADWEDKVYNLGLTYNGPVEVVWERKVLKEVPNVFTDVCADIAQRFGVFKQLSTNLCSYRCVYLPLGLLIENLNNENSTKDIAIIKAYSQVLDEIKMKGKIKCFDKEFIEENYTLSKRVKPKDHHTLVMMLPGSIPWKHVEYFSFDQ